MILRKQFFSYGRLSRQDVGQKSNSRRRDKSSARARGLRTRQDRILGFLLLFFFLFASFSRLESRHE